MTSSNSRPHSRPLRPRATMFTSAILLVILLASCSRGPLIGGLFGGESEATSGPLLLRVHLVQSNLRPGDALITSVTLQNLSRRSIQAQWLEPASLEFYLRGPGPRGPFRIKPVSSAKIPPGEPPVLKPGETVGRHFVFTTATEEPGAFQLQALYRPTPSGIVSDLAPTFSKAAAFQVAGERAFQRDRDGILLKDQAIAIAKQRLGRPTTDAVALLTQDPTFGAYVWWITLTIDPSDLKPDDPPRVAFFVNPYLGTIQPREAKPFVEKPAKPKGPVMPGSRPLPSPPPPETAP